jgi:hypothetical protein
VSEVNVRDGHFRPEAGLTGGNLGDGRVGKVAGGLQYGSIDVALRRLDVTLVVQPEDHISDHLTVPLEQGISRQFGNGGVQAGIIGGRVAQVDAGVHGAPDDRAVRELWQSLRCRQGLKVETPEAVERQRAKTGQPQAGEFQKVTSCKIFSHSFPYKQQTGG